VVERPLSEGDPAGGDPGLDAVADELYGLTPAAFTAARDSRAGDARRAGQRDLAAAIKKLRRPTAGAWLANLLVRERRQAVTDLLDLGAVMREAQAQLAGDELRRLSRQRQQVVAELGREARRLARDVGEPVGDDAGRELVATLEAALADATASESLRSGRLAKALHYTGLGPSSPGDGPSPARVPPPQVERAGTAPGVAPDGADHDEVDQVAEARRRRKERTDAAERALGEAQAAVVTAERDADGAAQQAGEARDRLDEVARQVDEAEQRLLALRAEHDGAVTRASQADEAERAAEEVLRQARALVVRTRAALDGCR
jgi:hypothetical protein